MTGVFAVIGRFRDRSRKRNLLTAEAVMQLQAPKHQELPIATKGEEVARKNSFLELSVEGSHANVLALDCSLQNCERIVSVILSGTMLWQPQEMNTNAMLPCWHLQISSQIIFKYRVVSFLYTIPL
jgi:hypothetical protein